MRIDLSCPVENRGVTVKTNSATGEPYALFRLFNLSDKTVDGVKFVARAYDAYGKELGAIPVELSELDGQPKSPFAVNKGVSLADFAEAKHVTADICEVLFSDGESYTVSEEQMTEVNYIQPDYDEVTRLKSAAGNDAVCYAQDPGAYWLCVCGRANRQDDVLCVRCGREKQTCLSKYSSHDSISKALEEKRQAAEAAEQERLAEEARLKEMKKQKMLKRLAIAACSLVCVAVLALLGFLSYRLIVTKIADGKAAKGEYVEAYDLYRSVGSSHIGNASEQAKGNSFSNLIQSGILTADNDWIYYINNSLHIMKQSKTGEESMQLGEEQAVSLCVSGDWLYYLNPSDGSLNRVKTDGSLTESVMEEQVAFYMTIGSDLYYLANDTEASDAQTAENSYAMALYCKNMKSGKVKKIASKQFYSLDFYKGKIYYIDGGNENKLSVMDINGKNARVVIDQPIYSFAIVNDVIYYSNGNMAEGASMPELTMEAVALDGTGKETLVSDKTVGLICADGNHIYFTSYDDENLYDYNTESKQTEIAPIENFNLCNVADDYVVYMTMTGEMVLKMPDGSKVNMGQLNTSAQ